MFLESKQQKTWHQRTSKLGKDHHYYRNTTVAVFRCDNCNIVFERNLGKMDHRRLSNHYFHVCSSCDAKKFAQRKGIEKRHIWDMPAGSDIDISKI